MLSATSFDHDISQWDVSSVTTMNGMFSEAMLFNRDISKWDVSSVVNMDGMFQDARSFNQKLCGAAWISSKASKKLMFAGSHGSFAPVDYTTNIPAASSFSPESLQELQSAVDTCLV